MKHLFLLLIVLLHIACAAPAVTDNVPVEARQNVGTGSGSASYPEPEKTPGAEPETLQATTSEYPGKTIDQIFPVIADYDFTDEHLKNAAHSVSAEGFDVNFQGFTPLSISKDGKKVFQFKPLFPGEYSFLLVGASSLLGPDSKQIYTVGVGPGTVCCTNYWITDISSGIPREIFRSEEFGGFRDPMEIFDAEGDGIYELVQYDAAFRYMMDMCGACGPEPRAVFKYDKRAGKYLPAPGKLPDFAMETLQDSWDHLREMHLKAEAGDWSASQELSNSLLSYVVQTMYVGKEKEAWTIFEEYYPEKESKARARKELKERIKGSKYLAALRKSKR